MNQNDAILAHLQKGHALTPLEALDLFGCFHLASRIDELHKRGISTLKVMVKLPSGKRVAQYSLHGAASLPAAGTSQATTQVSEPLRG